MGYFKHQSFIQTKLTNQWNELKTGLNQLRRAQLSKGTKLNRQALGLLGVGLDFGCMKSAKKWPGHFSRKNENHNYKPGLLPQAQGTEIRHKEVKTSSKSRPRLPLGPLVSDWHFYLGKLELAYHNKTVELWALPTGSETQMELNELKTSSQHKLKAFYKASLNFSTFWQQEIF